MLELDAPSGEVGDESVDVVDLPAEDGVTLRLEAGCVRDSQHDPVWPYAKDEGELVVAFKDETESVLVELLSSGCVGRWVVGMKPKGDEA